VQAEGVCVRCWDEMVVEQVDRAWRAQGT
jgi:hypothetical protein